MEFSDKQMKTFSDIWNELMKQKIKIIYEIAKEKREPFNNLLEEFVPEALDNKDLWISDYTNVEELFNESSVSITKTKTKKIIIKKKRKIVIKKKSKLKKKL